MPNELSETQIFKELCENDFSFFCQQYLKVVEPETEFEWNWHMEALCNHCEMVYYGDIQNLDINIPPRQLKTLIISILFPCWVWTKAPSKKVIAASRSYDLATSFNIKRRDLLVSEAYSSLWPPSIKDDMNTSVKFGNIFGGFMQAASALGKLTGTGADILISDDLLDATEAFSKNKRDSVNLWFSNTFYNRAQNKKRVKRINVNQRLHVEDVSGHIEAFHNFKKLILPMVMTQKNLSTTGFVDPRKEGEFLFPQRYAQAEMDDDYKSLGVYGWSSQHQQSPRPIGGGIIKEEWLRFYKGEPPGGRSIITADLSFKGNKDSDYVCFQAWRSAGTQRYLIDIVRGQWTYKISKERFKEFCDKHSYAQYKFIEDKANGPAMLSDLSGVISGMRAWPEKGSKYMNADKIQRLHMVSQDYENGNVYLPEGVKLVDLFVDELLGFTEKGSTSGNDDMVDTSTMALLELTKLPTFSLG